MSVPTTRRFICLAGLLAALLVPAIHSLSVAADPSVQPAARTQPLEIVSRSGRHTFEVEVMRNDADRARGLMYRRSMPADHGMLFDFEQPQPINMWMKNTYLSLDMLFIRSDGTIARIAADTEPLSTRMVPSNEPVLAVLELNAGTAARLEIRAGDRVEHSLFSDR